MDHKLINSIHVTSRTAESVHHLCMWEVEAKYSVSCGEMCYNPSKNIIYLIILY